MVAILDFSLPLADLASGGSPMILGVMMFTQFPTSAAQNQSLPPASPATSPTRDTPLSFLYRVRSFL
jgi:hypothetical protein